MVAVALGAVLFIAYRSYKTGRGVVESAADIVKENLNPASQNNVVYGTLNTVLFDDPEQDTIGTNIADIQQTVTGWFSNTGINGGAVDDDDDPIFLYDDDDDID